MSLLPSTDLLSNSSQQSLTLIPGLPNDLASYILSLLPFSHIPRLKATCKTWRSFLSCRTLFHLRSDLQHHQKSNLLCIFPQDPSLSLPYLFDPIHSAWSPLPPMPCSPHHYGRTNFVSISIGSDVYVLGGSLFDTRSFPIDHPRSSASVSRLDLSTFSWHRLSPMIRPRGSFACSVIDGDIIVAGGGSRHSYFGSGGSRVKFVERYDVPNDTWVQEEGLPRYRAGCTGFSIGEEFWVMGGYGNCRTVGGIFPVDEYYRDGVVFGLKSRTWREIGDMWEEGERRKLGSVVVVEGNGAEDTGIFMLDGNDISRFDMLSNRWHKESSLPRKPGTEASCGFIALNGELYVMSLLPEGISIESRKLREKEIIFIQVYNPRKKKWRLGQTKAPFKHPLDFKSAVLCSIQL